MRTLLCALIVVGLTQPLNCEPLDPRRAQGHELQIHHELDHDLGRLYISNATDNLFCVMVQAIANHGLVLEGGDKMYGAYTDFFILLPRQERKPTFIVRFPKSATRRNSDDWFYYLEIEVASVPTMALRTSMNDIRQLSGLHWYQLKNKCRDEVNWHYRSPT